MKGATRVIVKFTGDKNATEHNALLELDHGGAGHFYLATRQCASVKKTVA